jgi:hypothetical protein
MRGAMDYSRKQREPGRTMDGETLAFLIEKLRPSIKASIRGLIGQKLAALAVTLIQIERAVMNSSDTQLQKNIECELLAANSLCSRIQRDLSRGEAWAASSESVAEQASAPLKNAS